RYLAYLDDPASAVDQDAVAAAEAALASATDPIDKLHAAAARERAAATDVDALEAAFVAHAKEYAQAQSIPAAAFEVVGVPTDVLARAGFATGARGRSSGARRPASGSRAPQVSAAVLKDAALATEGPFTLAQLADAAGGGSPATVRKAVEELIAEGRATSLGPDPDHTGPGRAPTRYRRT
ncbi:MAG: hypothetical protein KDA97_09835, partial [Acidimicrobiales bacterium]|nr:hypothetical protein [Acidimicrobiales bacterium]